VGFDQYWDYEEENLTASANYRPRDSNTILRKTRARVATGLSGKKDEAPSESKKAESAAAPDATESPSFYKNPTQQSEKKEALKQSERKPLKSGPLVEFSPIEDADQAP
jgi:hypothetical protein